MTPTAPLPMTGKCVVLACSSPVRCAMDGRAAGRGASRARAGGAHTVEIDTAAATTAAEVALQGREQIVLAKDEMLITWLRSAGSSRSTWRSCWGQVTLPLLDMNGEADRPDNAAYRRAAVERARQVGLRKFILDETWPTHVAARHLTDPAMCDTVVAMAEAVGLEGFARQVEIAISRPRSLDILARLRSPTWCAVRRGRPITPRALAADISSAARAELVMVANAGHFAILERPGRNRRCYRALHRRCRAAGGSGLGGNMTNEQLLRAVEVDIVFGVHPSNSRLTEEMVTSRFGVKRYLVREVFSQLEKSGFINRFPNRGVVVVELNPTQVEDIYGVRELLETGAARKHRFRRRRR